MKQCRITMSLLGLFLMGALLSGYGFAQEQDAQRFAGIESRLSQLERQVRDQEQKTQTAKNEVESRISNLDHKTQAATNVESRVSRLEQRNRRPAIDGGLLFLFGAFCALWAQNTGRNPWGWFFLGLFFSVITVLFLLAKNSADKKDRPLELPLDR